MESASPRRKLLLISYLFPPAGGITVQRALSMAKYLPRCGFEVHVLSAGTAASPVLDPGLMRHVPPEVKLHRAFAPIVPFAVRQRVWKLISRGRKPATPAPQAARTQALKPARPSLADFVKPLICPDPEVVWCPFALRKASRLIRKYKIDTVLVTAPPFSAFLAGNALKRRFPHLRLVSDFRDDWVGFYLTEFGSLNNAATIRRSKEMERATVEGSDLVLVVTGAMLEGYRRRYPDVAPDKFALIANGYDPDSFPPVAARPRHGSDVVFTHTGTVYSASSPRTFLEAIGRLPEGMRRRIRTRFVGRIAETEKPLFEPLPEGVETLGFVPQKQALETALASDYLLLVMTDPTALTGKLFEYLAAGKPILALAPTNGEIARILEETGAGWCVDPLDTAAVARTLERLVERLDGGRPDWSPNPDAIRRYERPRLTEELAARIRSLG